MTNRLRGEISASLDGRQWDLVLTLGALAELEAAFACSDLTALVDRFSTGHLAASDLIRIIGAGLRGAGHDVEDAQVAAMTTVGGAAGFAAICSDLLAVTFGANDTPEEPEEAEPETGVNLDMSLNTGLVSENREAGRIGSVPFPGSP